jgi:U4/U6.U5 tri-snRNP-associated protein 2
MGKRQASEALEELGGIASPASKRSRMDEGDSPFENGGQAQTPSEAPNGQSSRDAGR